MGCRLSPEGFRLVADFPRAGLPAFGSISTTEQELRTTVPCRISDPVMGHDYQVCPAERSGTIPLGGRVTHVLCMILWCSWCGGYTLLCPQPLQSSLASSVQ